MEMCCAAAPPSTDALPQLLGAPALTKTEKATQTDLSSSAKQNALFATSLSRGSSPLLAQTAIKTAGSNLSREMSQTLRLLQTPREEDELKVQDAEDGIFALSARFPEVELPAFPGDAHGLVVPATEEFLSKSMGVGAMMMVLMPEEEAQVMNTQRNLLAIPQRERTVAQGKFVT